MPLDNAHVPTRPNITTDELARWLGLGVSTLRHMRARGDGPEYWSSGRSIRYSVEKVREWIARGGER